MKRAAVAVLATGAALIGTLGVQAPIRATDDGGRSLRASLRSIEEVPTISGEARGDFSARISDDGNSMTYTLSYSGLQGVVQQAHIHLGQRGVNGGIAVFLCSNLASPPPGTPACPGPDAGTVTRTVTGADIIGPAAQGLTQGEFAELLRAIDRGVTYANVHSDKFPAGEIRGPIRTED